MGLVVDLGPHRAVANPLKIPLSGFPAKVVARAYHLYAIPRGVNRWAVTLAYLTDAMFARSVVSLGSRPRAMPNSPPAKASRCLKPADDNDIYPSGATASRELGYAGEVRPRRPWQSRRH